MRLERALRLAGARLKRAKRHRVYQLPNGRLLVVAKSASDHRAERNTLARLRRLGQL